MTRQTGFTLIEWMIALTIGLFLTAGIFTIFTFSQQESNNSLDNSELLENGRVAINLLSKDLRMVGFLGDYTGGLLEYNTSATVSTTVANFSSSSDCLDDQNLGTFPTSVNTYKMIWSVKNTERTSSELKCVDFTDLTTAFDSDMIDLKFATPYVACANDACSLSDSNFYIATNPNAIYWFSGSDTTPSTSDMSSRRIFKFNHKVFFVAQDTNGDYGLYYTYLSNTFVGNTQELVPGVERMKILYAVDTSDTQDNIVDEYLPAEDVTSSQWNNNRVRGAHLYILVRASKPDYQYTNSNTYQLGNITYTPKDHYRRLLVQTTINFNNLTNE